MIQRGLGLSALGEAEGLQTRHAFIIDSLKHPDEVRALRHIFGGCFYLVGVVAREQVRRLRLHQRKGISASIFDELSGRDADEPDAPHGQHTAATVPLSDYFFVNEGSTRDPINAEASRLLRLIFNIGITSPHRDEFGMLAATRAAGRSACLSRQVGAAVVNATGELIATGYNDVPRAGGGLYGPEEDDQRCWVRGAKCYNDEEKKALVGELTQAVSQVLREAGREIPADVAAIVSRTLASSRVKSLIEFSRAVHAEMEAIISIARRSASGLPGATLYTTTFPCHNCAKHIIAAGILRVVYLEPYEKSLARKLHGDAIRDPNGGEDERSVPFDMYAGAAPSRYAEFFEMRDGDRRKHQGIYLDQEHARASMMPRGAQSMSELAHRISKALEHMKSQRRPGDSQQPAQNSGGGDERGPLEELEQRKDDGVSAEASTPGS